jgi:hypothetical protein
VDAAVYNADTGSIVFYFKVCSFYLLLLLLLLLIAHLNYTFVYE